MAIIITDECINCGACEPECPNNAIYEGAVDWKASDGTSLKGTVTLKSGLTMDANAPQRPVSDDVCPVDCCVPDDNHVETDAELLGKKAFLHGE